MVMRYSKRMLIRKFRWSKVYESAEEELLELFAQRHITAEPWSGTDGEVLTRQFSADTQLWCAEGLLACTIDGKTYSLQPGDALDIPADTQCSIRVGFGGCTAYESPASVHNR